MFSQPETHQNNTTQSNYPIHPSGRFGYLPQSEYESQNTSTSSSQHHQHLRYPSQHAGVTFSGLDSDYSCKAYKGVDFRPEVSRPYQAKRRFAQENQGYSSGQDPTLTAVPCPHPHRNEDCLQVAQRDYSWPVQGPEEPNRYDSVRSSWTRHSQGQFWVSAGSRQEGGLVYEDHGDLQTVADQLPEFRYVSHIAPPQRLQVRPTDNSPSLSRQYTSESSDLSPRNSSGLTKPKRKRRRGRKHKKSQIKQNGDKKPEPVRKIQTGSEIAEERHRNFKKSITKALKTNPEVAEILRNAENPGSEEVFSLVCRKAQINWLDGTRDRRGKLLHRIGRRIIESVKEGHSAKNIQLRV